MQKFLTFLAKNMSPLDFMPTKLKVLLIIDLFKLMML